VVLQEPIDFAATDTEATLAKVRLLAAAATYFNTRTVADYGGRVGPALEPGLIEHAVGAAFQTRPSAARTPTPAPSTRRRCCCAASRRGIRSTTATSAPGSCSPTYLDQRGFPAPDSFPDEGAFDLCLRISAGQLSDVGAISVLQLLWAL
jgi:hypothetical protein